MTMADNRDIDHDRHSSSGNDDDREGSNRR
jgi:hypothetical protein